MLKDIFKLIHHFHTKKTLDKNKTRESVILSTTAKTLKGCKEKLI